MVKNFDEIVEMEQKYLATRKELIQDLRNRMAKAHDFYETMELDNIVQKDILRSAFNNLESYIWNLDNLPSWSVEYTPSSGIGMMKAIEEYFQLIEKLLK